VIGYNSVTHLAPAVLGAMVFFAGLVLVKVMPNADDIENRLRRHAAVD
jgi:hypothetical protein